MASGDDLIGLLLKAAVEGGDKERVGPKQDRAMSHESRTHAARAVMGALKKGDLDAFDQALHAYFTCCKMEHGDTDNEEYVGHR